MAQPNFRGELVTGPLRNVSCAYRNQGYVADRVFPIIDTNDPKAKIMRILKGSFFRNEAGIRGAGGRAKRGGYVVDWEPFNTKEYAFAKEVTLEDRRACTSLMGPPLQPDQKGIEFAADKIDLAKEVFVATIIKATVWSGVAAGGEDAAGLWAPNDATNTFLADVKLRKRTLQAATGALAANMKLLVTGDTWDAITQVDAIVDLIRYNQVGILDTQILARILGVGEVIVAEAIENTAKEAKAGTDWTSAPIWDVNAGHGAAFLFYRHPTVGLDVPLVGAQVRLAQTIEGGGLPRRTTTWYEPAEHQDVYEVAEETDIIAVGLDLGFMWKDTIVT